VNAAAMTALLPMACSARTPAAEPAYWRHAAPFDTPVSVLHRADTRLT
jgi:hypothetical protein